MGIIATFLRLVIFKNVFVYDSREKSEETAMKKYMPFLLILCFLVFTGCSVKKTNTEKIRDIEFTVVEEESIPTELKSEIEEIAKVGKTIKDRKKVYFEI